MKTSVKKWGNSLAIRIPRIYAREIQIADGAKVSLQLKSGKLVLSRVALRTPSLRSLLSRVRKSNLHSEAEWGPPQGKELW